MARRMTVADPSDENLDVRLSGMVLMGIVNLDDMELLIAYERATGLYKGHYYEDATGVLTIAMRRTGRAARANIIYTLNEWVLSHEALILSGRKHAFYSLRRTDGIGPIIELPRYEY